MWNYHKGILDGTIATTVADSGATSGVGTTADPCHHSGWPSNKQFILPSSDVISATEMAEHPFNVRAPANELHITPGVSQHSLLSLGKFANANYIRFLTRKWSTYMTPMTPSSPSAKEPFYVVFATRSSTSTKFCWLTW
jgi:hypothetical protein